MNGSDSGAAAPGAWKSWVVVAAVLALPLSGCMSSGASTFANSLAETTGSVKPADDPLRAIALDVAAPEAAPATSDAPNDRLLAGAADETEITEISALAPREDERPAQRQLSLMSPAASAARLELAAPPPVQAALAVPDDDRAVAFDPTEAAAQARIPALYASIDHGQCEGGWGPKPTMINAKRIVSGHPYYMEMRLRHTPPLPVGHVYIAYGRIGPDGNPLDEKLVMLAPVGGYGGAAVAAAVPMPGVQKPYGDDCVLRPIAAYRVSLSASQFEQLLLEIERQREKKPTYALFAYNCNHFMSDVAKSVGILPPQNIYTPSLQYFYDMMDRNEGRRVARTADELKLAAAN